MADKPLSRPLAQLGFPALATTSSGFAWSMGLSDNHVTLEEALEHYRAVPFAEINGAFKAWSR